MSDQISSSAVIVIVIAGAAAVVLAGYALHRTFAMRVFGGDWEAKKFNERNVEQDQYMIDMRMAYRNDVMADARSGRVLPKHDSPLPV